MKNTICRVVICFLCGVALLSRTQSQPPASGIETNTLATSASAFTGVRNPKVKNIFDSIGILLAPMKGYTAHVENQGLDPLLNTASNL